jgi:hypothetical protein
MLHAKSLRVIGQVLEAAEIAAFEVEKHSPEYVVWSASLTNTAEQVVRNALKHGNGAPHAARQPKTGPAFCFSPADISRLDAQAQKRRGSRSFSNARGTRLLSHGLRTLGDHLDKVQVTGFHIMWTLDSVILDYERVNGQRNCRTFAAEELQTLCAHPRLRRSSLYLFPPLDVT